MKIGMCYDLKDDYLAEGFSAESVAEFDRADTIDAIENAIRVHGHEAVRIGGIRRLTEALAAGHRWDLVFNIAEGLYGPTRESQIPALLEAYRIPCVFSDSLVLAVCLHKGLAKTVALANGIPTSPFLVVEEMSGLDAFALHYPVFAKPALGGTSQGVYAESLAANMDDLKQVCSLLLDRFAQPVIIEEYLPGREFTVGIVGSGSKARSVGALEVGVTGKDLDAFYSYKNKQEFETSIRYALVHDEISAKAEKTALEVWKALGCRDAGRIDLRCDAKGRPCFIECNPLAGLNPEISDLSILCTAAGITYNSLIGEILDSAISRSFAQAPVHE